MGLRERTQRRARLCRRVGESHAWLLSYSNRRVAGRRVGLLSYSPTLSYSQGEGSGACKPTRGGVGEEHRCGMREGGALEVKPLGVPGEHSEALYF